MKKAVICDLDGTLCDISERRKFVNSTKKDWAAFSCPENIAKDKPNNWCCELVKLLSGNQTEILFVSGRMNSKGVDKCTIEWIKKYTGLKASLGENLFMRNDADYRKDTDIKQEIYDTHIKGKYEILFALDDRKVVVDMWRENNLTCLQCDVGDF
jgi:predicted secreted acid phosphatase